MKRTHNKKMKWGLHPCQATKPDLAAKAPCAPPKTVPCFARFLFWLQLVVLVVFMAKPASGFQFHEADYVIPWPVTTVNTPILSGATVAWADYNQDGLADYAVAGTMTNGVSGLWLYRTVGMGNGNKNFTNTQTLVEEMGGPITGLAWGDYNNDGWPDLAVAGPHGLVLYQNNASPDNPSGRILEPVPGNHHLQGVGARCLAWIDYDSDGSLDLVCSGFDANQIPSSGMYRNINHGERFERDDLISPGLSPYLTSLEVGDYDADGYPDLLAAGISYSVPNIGARFILYHNERLNPGNITRIFRQDGAFPVLALTRCKAVWGDFNNDRLLDAFVTGYSSSGFVNRSYLCFGQTNQQGGWTWSQPQAMERPLKDPSLAVGDLNNDGRTDLVAMGLNGDNALEFNLFINQAGNLVWDGNGSTYVPRGGGESVPVRPLNGSLTLAHSAVPAYSGGLNLLMVGVDSAGQAAGELLVNSTPIPSLVPPPTLSITSTPAGNLRFKWTVPYDPSSLSRTFDLAVGRTNRGVDIVSPNCLIRDWSYRSIPGRGNMGYARELTLYQTGLLPGDYLYGSIQSVDDSFNVSYSYFGQDSFTPSGPYRLPFLLHGAEFPQDPGRVAGAAAWGDFDHDGDLDLLMQGDGGSMVKLYINDGIGNFTLHPQCLLSPANGGLVSMNGSVEWGDANGDGNLDFLVSGAGLSLGDLMLFRNSGPPGFTFSPETVDSGFYGGHASFGDFDNDGDQDIVAVTGEGRASKTVIYRNDGPANPAQPLGARHYQPLVMAHPLAQLGEEANVVWCDFDNDGWLDLIVSGVNPWPDQNTVTKLYHNLGPALGHPNDWQFTEIQGLNLPQVNRATMVWGDVDADGFPDLFIAGRQYNVNSGVESYVTTLFVNRPIIGNAGRTLVRADALPAEFDVARLETGGYGLGHAVMGDINNDGRLDLIFGTVSPSSGTSVFLNQFTNGVINFVRAEPVSSGSYPAPDGTILPGDLPSPQAPVSLALGDYDGDGRLDLLAPYTLPGGAGNTLTLFHNNFPVFKNYPPVAPTMAPLQVQFDEVSRELHLSWAGTSDDGPLSGITPATGLTYNLSLSPVDQSKFLVAPNSAADGWRRVAPVGRWGSVTGGGEVNQWFSWTLRSFQPLLDTEYRFAVQAVDNGLMGSPFAGTNFHYHAYVAGALNTQTALGPQPLAGWTVFLDANANDVLDAGEATAFTAADGTFSFEVSTAGTYAVREAPLPWCWVELSRPLPILINNESAGHTFGGQDILNQQQATLTGAVYFDRNQNGHRDVGEELVDFWDIFLDANNNGIFDNGAGANPVENGQRPGSLYEFSCIPPGVPTTIAIALSPGAPPLANWQITEPAVPGGAYRVSSDPGQTLTNNFGVYHPLYDNGSIYGHLWVDANADGVMDLSEPLRLEGWRVYIDNNHNRQLDDNEPNVVSGSAGTYLFNSVPAGNRVVRVEVQPGWQQTFPLNGQGQSINVAGITYVNRDFGFFQVPQAQRLIEEIKGFGTDGSFSFILGTHHLYYRVESSDDLIHWTTNAVISTTSGSREFKDGAAGTHTRRFYRAVPQ